MNPAPADLTLPRVVRGGELRAEHFLPSQWRARTAMPSWLMFKGREIWDLVAYIHKMHTCAPPALND